MKKGQREEKKQKGDSKMPRGVYLKTKEHKKNISKALRGRHLSEETRRKISKLLKGHIGVHHSGETRIKIGKASKGRICSDETKRKLSKAMSGNQNSLGCCCSEETKRKLSRFRKGLILSDDTKKKMSEAAKIRSKILWQNPEYKENQLHALFAGRLISPNRPERKLRNGLNKMFPGEYKFVGDGQTFIGGKSPDFINVNGQKKIIEMFGDYWHSKKVNGRTKIQEENQRIKHFAKYGFRTLIIWECELKNIKELKKKLVEFQGAARLAGRKRKEKNKK